METGYRKEELELVAVDAIGFGSSAVAAVVELVPEELQAARYAEVGTAFEVSDDRVERMEDSGRRYCFEVAV
jgi:hypothetical protein